MNGYLPKKELVFFNPGTPGVIFTLAANHYITAMQLLKAQECLVMETGLPVVYIEDRRKKARRSRETHRFSAVGS